MWLMVSGRWLVARTPCLRTLSLWGASGVGRLLIRPICATSGCPILRNCLTSGETFAPCRGFAPSCSSVCPSILSLTVEPVDPHRQYRRSRGRLRPRSAFSRHRLYLQPREGRASARPGKLRLAGTASAHPSFRCTVSFPRRTCTRLTVQTVGGERGAGTWSPPSQAVTFSIVRIAGYTA